MNNSIQPEDGANGPAGRTEPGEGDSRARIATIALAALSALFFAGALAYAVSGGLLSGDDGGPGDRRTLPREWANMIPLQPVGPELVDGDPGAGGSNGFGANGRPRGGPAGFFVTGTRVPPFRPVAARPPGLRPALGVRRIRPRGGLFRPVSAIRAPRLDRVGIRLPRLPDVGGGGGGGLPDVDPIPGPVIPPTDPGPGGGPVPPIDVEIPPILVDIPPIVVRIPPIDVNLPGGPILGGVGTPPLLPLTQASAVRPSELSLAALAGAADGDAAEGSNRSRFRDGDAGRRERPPAPGPAASPTGAVDPPSVRGADRRDRRDERYRGKAETPADRTERGERGSLESAHCQAPVEPKLPPAGSERPCDDEADGEATKGEAHKATERLARRAGRAAPGAGA